MERPDFEVLKDAKIWVAEDAISRAVLPFRSVLGTDDLEALQDFLEMLVWTHPFVRTLLTRAGRRFLPVRERQLREAAREDDLEEAIPLTPVAEVLLLEPGLVGKPNLKDPSFFKPALSVVRALAKYVLQKWKRNDYDDLVAQGWVDALEVSSEWEASKSSFVTFLWGRVRNRLIDHCKKHSNSRESVACYKWSDKVVPGQFAAEDDVDRLYEAVNTAATSFTLGLMHSLAKTPEEQLMRAEEKRLIETHRSALPERRRRILELHYEEGRVMPDVAKELRVSLSTADRDHHAALGEIRQAFEKGSNVVSIGAPKKAVAPATRPLKPPKKSAKKVALKLVASSEEPDDEDD